MNIKGIKIELPREPHYSTRILELIFIPPSGDCKHPSHWVPLLTFFMKSRPFLASKRDRHSLVLFPWLLLSISLFICFLDRISLDLEGQQGKGREEDKWLHGWVSPGGLGSRRPMCGVWLVSPHVYGREKSTLREDILWWELVEAVTLKFPLMFLCPQGYHHHVALCVQWHHPSHW